jgi:flagellar basal-body rod modification protein FlgD
MATSIISPVTSTVTSGTTPVSGTTSSTSGTGIDTQTIAGNFTDFLKLLTTQLQNQNPMDPLDTNQFTQQLVQFAQVEQQLKSNDQLGTLVSLQQTAQSTAALDFVGKTVGLDGSTAPLTNSSATWSLSSSKPAAASVNITNAAGQTVYSTNITLNAGASQNFTWDGKGTDGSQWPDGSYTIAVNAVDASGQPAAVATQITGMVDSADLTQTPATLSVNGQDYPLTAIKRVMQN